MNESKQLPNQTNTWAKLSKNVEEFPVWQKRKQAKFADEHTEVLFYLQDQLKAEGTQLHNVSFNHQVLGLLSYTSEKNNRMQELLFAYLAIVVADDLEPAKKLIAGQRLKHSLHPEYVEKTRCYG